MPTGDVSGINDFIGPVFCSYLNTSGSNSFTKILHFKS